MNAPLVQTAKRNEDLRFVVGAGRYTGDLRPDRLAYLVFVRSPHAHARILSVDVSAAAESKGVLLAFAASDLTAAGLKESPGGFGVPRPDGQPAPRNDRPALAADRVRHVGEPVAAVVARTLAEAEAAAELVEVEYEPLPVVTTANALQPGVPVVWENAPDNIGFRWQGGDAAAVDQALAKAVHVTTVTMKISRVSATPMEVRNVMAVPEKGGRFILHASHQSPYTLVQGLEAAGFPKGSVAVKLGDVGGSFGLKMGIIQEAIPVLYAARKLKRPVLWESTRTEGFLADDHARELEATTEIGFDRKRRILALRVRSQASLGAYLSGKSGWSITNIGSVAGVYDIPAIHAEVTGYFTHAAQTAAYRGAGRPEATYMLERALDVAARELKLTPFELRRRNLIPASAMPYKTALVFHYDCGDFPENMSRASILADVAGFPDRRRASARRGMLRGLGVANCIEVAGGPFNSTGADICRVSLLDDGRLKVQSGTMSVGQGFETVFPQMVADRFGVPLEAVVFKQGDTDDLPFGRGNGGSSGLSTGGTALTMAADVLAGTLTQKAAEMLEVRPDSVTLSDGIFRSASANRTVSLAEIAGALPPVSEGVAAEGTGTFKPPAVTFPNGTHLCEVEIDPDTGVVTVVGYWAVEDIGRVVNPMLAEGQIQGGVAQGIGQALGEEIIYDEDGQLLSASFMDYQMPRAADLPSYHLAFHEVPTAVNPLGSKGVGEAGTVGSLSAAMNAVNDALAQVGIRHFDMPATPSRVWAAIRQTKGG